ncbi:MAG: ABC transporter permease subunit [Candidatus Lokiarchaeota archaeon]|nr:ABC transporter permease subunit [Candidatus Lokiarchaeota archaeon]MBD3200508.1 ABC transporter permease subunit [Candidatus Lokiarchaeota archaeon]
MLEQEVYEIKEEDEIKKLGLITKNIIKWVINNLKFIFIPAYKLNALVEKEEKHERTVSKRKFIRRFKSFLTILGIILVFAVVTMAVFPHWLAPYTEADASGVFPGTWANPSPEHPLGTTSFGRDVLTRLIFGARTSLIVALPAIGLSVILGVIIGIIAAFYGGWLDTVIMRLMDILLAFPGLILALVFISVFTDLFKTDVRIEYIMLAWGILGVPFYSRLIRGSVLQAKELPYIQAARVAGAGNFRIMFKHILPNVIQPIIISVTFDIGGIILSLAGLSFLGFSDPQLIDWGNEISRTRERLYDAPWASLFPGFFILLSVLGFMLLGDGLRDALDPRLRDL